VSVGPVIPCNSRTSLSDLWGPGAGACAAWRLDVTADDARGGVRLRVLASWQLLSWVFGGGAFWPSALCKVGERGFLVLLV